MMILHEVGLTHGARKCPCNGFYFARLPEAQLAEWFCVPTNIIGPNRNRGFSKAEVGPSVTCWCAPLLMLGAA